MTLSVATSITPVLLPLKATGEGSDVGQIWMAINTAAFRGALQGVWVLSSAVCTALERGLLLALKQMAKGLQGVIQEAALGEARRDLQDAVDHQ